ncbi:hypothetical protein CEY16_02265 [Halalkalibacillus sediminis]|uniref:YCII-related domain-containing protein n=1 Tax=Halalkalibacillus sediminis TaxID=2018042 RepID=A0A2I0QW82_9BACI|nr:YciI family protein [Halalkalibacillus sediminis]PKR78601.1 hypothetical protein CEY16_02265 [Halalkalibacillus sediminis]
MRYLILLTPSINWKDNVVLHNQPFMPEHALYVQTEYNKGNIVLTGPFGGSTGGAIVIDAAKEEDVIKFAENDPTVKNGIFSYEIKQWDYKMSKIENENPDFGHGYIDYKHKIQKELGII